MLVGILGILFLVGFVMLFIHLLDKYAGVRVKPKYSSPTNNRTTEFLIDETKKRNPKLYEKAIVETQRKKYKMTYDNVLSEIHKIEKKEPEWVKENKIAQSQLSSNKSKASFDPHGLWSMENFDLIQIHFSKVQGNENWTEEELRILNTQRYKDWELKVEQQNAQNSKNLYGFRDYHS